MVTDIEKIKRIKKRKAKKNKSAQVFVMLLKYIRKVFKLKKLILDISISKKDRILDLRKIRNYSNVNYFETPKYSHPILFKIFTVITIISLISMQALLISGFEAHIINITATIVNDVPDINPKGGEFCDIEGATITLTTTLTGTSTIIYTTDGSDPVCPDQGNIYSGPFKIYQSGTVKARTCHDGKQSIVMSQYFDVLHEYCPPGDCSVEPIEYWQANEGCENLPPESNWQIQINNLSSGYFQSAFATTTGQEICSLFDLLSCPSEGTIQGELCRSKGKALANHSNIATGRLDLKAVIAGAFDNSQAFIDLNLTASSTIEESLNKVESIIINPGATLNDLINAGYVAERIYTFYNEESPYLPDPTCIYWEPGDIVLNEFVPNPTCEAQLVDVVIVMDTSGSMGWDTPTRLSQAITAANNFVNNLEANDQSALVSYDFTATLDKILSNNHASTTEAINNLTAAGATNIGDGIAFANNELISVRANPAAAKVEILLTDGKANKPNGPGYGEDPLDVAYAEAKAVEAANQGIRIFTIGLGANVNTTMLENIASSTGAEYHYAPTGDDLAAIYQQIAEELCSETDDNLFGLGGEWVELYNKGTTTDDVADWKVANAATTTITHIGPLDTHTGSTTIGAVGSGNEWLVIFLNGGRLDNNGDTIFLYDNVNLLVDYYSYTSSIDNDPDLDPDSTPGGPNVLDGDLAGQEGKSFARIPDGAENWVDPVPTPGAPNMLSNDIEENEEPANDENLSSEVEDEFEALMPLTESGDRDSDSHPDDTVGIPLSQSEHRDVVKNIIEETANEDNIDIIQGDSEQLNNEDDVSSTPDSTLQSEPSNETSNDPLQMEDEEEIILENNLENIIDENSNTADETDETYSDTTMDEDMSDINNSENNDTPTSDSLPTQTGSDGKTEENTEVQMLAPQDRDPDSHVGKANPEESNEPDPTEEPATEPTALFETGTKLNTQVTTL